VPPILKRQPTCFDGRNNGEETGVDCGGSCSLLCVFEVEEPVVLWSRVFPAGPDHFHALAYIENRNKDAATMRATYTFELRDNENRIIADRTGEAFIPPLGRTAIFESWIPGSKNRDPARTVFTIRSIEQWVRTDGNAYANLPLVVEKRELQNFDTQPKLHVVLANKGIVPISDFDVIAILYDENDNAVQIGKSYMEEIAPESKRDLFFTWALPLLNMPSHIEIITRVNPFTLN